MDSRVQDWIAVVLPSVWFIPLLDALIPIYFHRPREIAGYFATLAFAREPIHSFFYMTPAESYASLHLHSLLAAPLVALGYHEGGRLVSLLATIAAALILYQFGRELTGKRFAGLAAGLGFWVIPFTQRFAYAFQPEALSIALTTGVVYLTHRYVTDRDSWAFYGSLGLLVCAILTHRWEAIVLAPVGVLYALNQEWRKFAVTTVVAIVTVAVVGFVVGLQPSNPSQLISYGIHKQGLLFLNLDWWLTHLPAAPPITIFHIGVTALLPATILVAVLWGWQFYRRRSDTAALLAIWHAAALSLPFLFPAGFLAHEYYLWATVAPMALTFGIVGSGFRWPIADAAPSWKVVALTVVVAMAAIGGQVATTEYGSLDRDTPPRAFMNGQHEYESYGAGRRIARYQSDSVSVAFIGPEFRDHNYDNYAHAHGRVLVYSDLLIRERAPGRQGGKAIYVDNMSQLNHCTMYVHRQGRELTTDRCAALNLSS